MFPCTSTAARFNDGDHGRTDTEAFDLTNGISQTLGRRRAASSTAQLPASAMEAIREATAKLVVFEVNEATILSLRTAWNGASWAFLV